MPVLPFRAASHAVPGVAGDTAPSERGHGPPLTALTVVSVAALTVISVWVLTVVPVCASTVVPVCASTVVPVCASTVVPVWAIPGVGDAGWSVLQSMAQIQYLL